jgi:predicted kinase
MRITCIAGLSGSGKSTLCQAMVAEGRVRREDVYDDVFRGIPHTQADLAKTLRGSLEAGRDCVVTDVTFCDPWERFQLEELLARLAPRAEVVWLFFENTPEGCRANVRRRALQAIGEALARMTETIGYIRRDAGAYVIPPGTRAMPVARSAVGRQGLVLKALLWLGYGRPAQAGSGDNSTYRLTLNSSGSSSSSRAG